VAALRLGALASLRSNHFPIPIRPQNFRLTSSRLDAKLIKVKMEKPLWVGGIELEAGSAMLNADAWGFMLLGQIDALSEPSAPAFGKETTCPAGIQGNSRFAMQNSPSLSVLFRLYPVHKMKVNQGESR
jgi:hypothetical protein